MGRHLALHLLAKQDHMVHLAPVAGERLRMIRVQVFQNRLLAVLNELGQEFFLDREEGVKGLVALFVQPMGPVLLLLVLELLP
ncbi:hypothetical protein PG987_016386 [Apiospora arundinis]